MLPFLLPDGVSYTVSARINKQTDTVHSDYDFYLNGELTSPELLAEKINDPLTKTTTFLGLPNRLLDGDDKQSGANIFKNLIGWQNNAPLWKKIANAILMPLVIATNLLLMPLELLRNIAIFLIRSLLYNPGTFCDKKSRGQNNLWRLGRNILWFLSDFLYGMICPIHMARYAIAEGKAQRALKDGLGIWPLFWSGISFFITCALLLTVMVPLLPVILPAAAAGVGLFITQALTPVIINWIALGLAAATLALGPPISRAIESFQNAWHKPGIAQKTLSGTSPGGIHTALGSDGRPTVTGPSRKAEIVPHVEKPKQGQQPTEQPGPSQKR